MIETVNGYVCHNCSDAALAKRNIDPAHPKDGPDGSDRKLQADAMRRGEAVTLGGNLSRDSVQGARQTDQLKTPADDRAIGTAVDITI